VNIFCGRENEKQMREELAKDPLTDLDRLHLTVLRPKTRGDCKDGSRPCPWVSCKFNTYLLEVHGYEIEYQQTDVMDMKVSNCALDYAENGEMNTLEAVGEAFGMSKQTMLKIEDIAMRKLIRRGLKETDFDFPKGHESNLASAQDFATGDSSK